MEQKGKAGFAFGKTRACPRHMKAAIRIASLSLGGSGPKTLAAMEAHGKRQDRTSQSRRVRDRDPLIFNSLDLRDAFDAHVEGARSNKSLKRPVLHAVIQFPKVRISDKSERAMLAAAIKFINETHGGDAVFAARLDRDERGRHAVDVFYSPKYEKHTKSRGVETWISTSKHGKQLCQLHRAEIERRHGGRFLTGPRQVGIAMQSELRAFLVRHGFDLSPKQEKNHSRCDRLEPEELKAQNDIKQAKKALEAVSKEKESLERARAKLTDDAAEVLRSKMTMERILTEVEHEVKKAERAIPRSVPASVRTLIIGVLEKLKRGLKQWRGDSSQVDRCMLDIISPSPQPTDLRSKKLG